MTDNRRCIMTVVSADWYQHIIPLFIRSMRRWGEGVDTRIYIRGEADAITNNCMRVLEEFAVTKGNDYLQTLEPDTYGTGISSTNAARFLHCDPELLDYDYVLIVDIDLLLFNDPFLYHITHMAQSGERFAGHHGPLHKPRRPEVCPAWQGPFERVAGGFFCVTPEWYVMTAKQRIIHAHDLKKGITGWWRESDEVILARIIKGCDRNVPTNKYFPPELRGVHLGDFREDMRHRWTNLTKMHDKLTADNCRAFCDIEKDSCWQEMLDILKGDTILSKILENVRIHCKERGIQ